MTNQMRRLQKIGVNAYVTYQRTNKVVIVSARDYLMSCYNVREKDGTLLHAFRSN